MAGTVQQARMSPPPVSPLVTKSEGSSPLGLDRGRERFFRPEPDSEASSEAGHQPLLIEKGLHYLLSSIQDKVEEIKVGLIDILPV